ncbi:HEAT repeat domain-containing protein [Endothiovibrio diazotrophicus]
MGLLKKTNRSPEPADSRHLPRDLAGLLVQLDEPAAQARRWAARDLAEHPQAVEALCRRLERETDATVRQVILTSLIRIGDPPSVQCLVPLLRSDVTALRNEVAEALRGMGTSAGPYVEGLLHDRDPDIRIFALGILDALAHPEIREWLTAAIRREDHVNVCAAAIELCVELGDASMIPELEAAAARFPEEPFIRFAVDLALRRIRANEGP